MTYEIYHEKKFKPETVRTIETAELIIEEYRDQGFSLTLRQLYYQFVARGLIENSDQSYKRLGKVITDARMAGLISWRAIEDRGRGVNEWLIEEDERETLRGIERSFAFDMWERQNVYVEAWIEKEALADVLRKPCSRWRVPYMACKGYLSASEAWRSGLRYRSMSHDRPRVVLLHLGDHDPSGLDMTRDNRERVERFSFADVEVRRLALNMDQVEQYNPPRNPAKVADSRAAEYIAEHGRSSWELDALDPATIDRLVDSAIRDYVDVDQWNEDLAEEAELRKPLADLSARWSEVKDFLGYE